MWSDHLVAIGSEFALWRDVCVRGAGFPARDILALAAPELSVAIDRYLDGDGDGDGERRPEDRDGAAALAELAVVFEAAHRASADQLRRAAADPRLREAIAWQNPNALRTGFDSLLRQPAGARDSKTRQKERLVASYLQRYAVKNDSIGFFGPVGWARCMDVGPALEMRPGPALLARRRVYFEHWAIAALAATLEKDPALRRHLAPRLHPGVRLEGDQLLHPGGATPLPAPLPMLLAACDGERTAAQLGAALGIDVTPVLAMLVEQGALLWRLDVPTVGQPFEAHLRARLAQVPEAQVRDPALAALDELCAARDAVAAAAGDPGALERAVAELEARFVRLTGVPAHRHPGRTYGGRTLIYEDCQRDIEISIGPPLLAQLGPPLELLLLANRWYNYEVARCYRPPLAALFQELGGGAPVEMTVFWPAVARLFPRAGGVAPPAVSALLHDYQRRWAELLAIPEGARVVTRPISSIAVAARQLFDAPGPGFPTARYHSPDIMVAEAGGELLFVLGELHANLNTLEQELFVQEHPEPAALRAALAVDLPEGRIAPVVPGHDAGRCRATPYSEHSLDVAVEFDDTRSPRPRAQTIAVSKLLIRERSGQLVVATRDGARTWDLIQALDAMLSEISISLLPEAAHLPRVAIGALVIQRETWRVPADALAFASDDDVLRRCIATRALARRLCWPRFVFYKTAAEPKPCFLDLHSPILIETFTRLVRGQPEVVVSEMSPALDELWLADREGNLYTSELRLVAVDRRAPVT
jgi:hypothetical protein